MQINTIAKLKITNNKKNNKNNNKKIKQNTLSKKLFKNSLNYEIL